LSHGEGREVESFSSPAFGRAWAELSGLWLVLLRQLQQVLEERLPLPSARPPQGSSGWAEAADGEQEGQECV
jgi:hypothetical protein